MGLKICKIEGSAAIWGTAIGAIGGQVSDNAEGPGPKMGVYVHFLPKKTGDLPFVCN